MEVNSPFLICFTLSLKAIFQVQAPGGLIFEGAIQRRVFCVTSLGGLIFGGDYTGRGLFSEFYGSLNEEMTEKETGRERK